MSGDEVVHKYVYKRDPQVFQTFDALSRDFCAYLKQIRRREGTIKRYDQLWGRVKIFMDSSNMQFYDKQVGEAYLHHLLEAYNASQEVR